MAHLKPAKPSKPISPVSLNFNPFPPRHSLHYSVPILLLSMAPPTHQTAQTVHSQGIYHGLPTFPSDPGAHGAIVCGASGISGQAMLKVLSANPARWSGIYSFSRGLYVGGGADGKGGGVGGEQIRHLQLDFLAGPELIARGLVGYAVEAEYVFFFAYKDGAEEENGELFSALGLWERGWWLMGWV